MDASAAIQPRRPLVTVTPEGLFCERGGVHIDPWRPVARALITHAHGDRARSGHQRYLGTRAGEALLRRRVGDDAPIDSLEYADPLRLQDVTVSFHPAGHVLGSAQLRIEHRREVWVVSGDYRRAADPTCAPFEVVRCDTFITEAAFGLPIFRWDDSRSVAEDMLRWWDANRAVGRTAVLFCYALGKAQRVLGGLARLTDRPVFVHGALQGLVTAYREAGVEMLPTRLVSETEKGTSFAGALVLAPPSAGASTWMRRFGDAETGFAAGWMRVRGNRRRRGFDRGFVLSDHADWQDLLRTVADTGAARVLTTHGSAESLARYLREQQGVEASSLATSFEDEAED